MKSYLITQFLFLLMVLPSGHAQELQDVESMVEQNQNISRKEKTHFLKDLRAARKARRTLLADPEKGKQLDRMEQFQKAVLADPILQMRLKAIMDSCSADSKKCAADLEALIVEVAGDPSPTGQILGGSKGTFGICDIDKSKKDFHALVIAKREYNCKLSTAGVVYERKVLRNTYGPGLYTNAHSLLLACSGNAFGTTTAGLSYGAGLYYGLALGTTFGSPGVCLYIGAGKAIGAYVGADVLKFGKQ